MNIRLDSTVDAPDVEICEGIKISGRIAEDDDDYEYKCPLTITCATCDTIHEVWILIN